MIRKKNAPLTSSAEVVDNHLIIALPNAIEPVVWRMELDKVGTASFEIKEIKTSGHYKFNLKPKKGTAEIIATFETKDDALNALVQSSDAMQNPVTSSNVKTKNDKEQKINIVTSAAPQSEPKSKGINKWVKLLLGLLIVVGLYAYLMSLMPNRINNLSDSPAATPSSSTPQTGVPLSADDFLNGM